MKLLPALLLLIAPLQMLAAHPGNGALKEKALSILDAKCNFCHRKQNPFRVFRERNMDKHAKAIYRRVFIERTMPLGGQPALTAEEMSILKAWIATKIPVE